MPQHQRAGAAKGAPAIAQFYHRFAIGAFGQVLSRFMPSWSARSLNGRIHVAKRKEPEIIGGPRPDTAYLHKACLYLIAVHFGQGTKVQPAAVEFIGNADQIFSFPSGQAKRHELVSCHAGNAGGGTVMIFIRVQIALAAAREIC